MDASINSEKQNPEIDNGVHPPVYQEMRAPENQEMRPQVNNGMQPQVFLGVQPQVNYVVPQQMVGQQQSSTTVVFQQPIQQNNLLVVPNLHGHRLWSTGLCDCFQDVENCLFTCFCYCCAVCGLAGRTGESCCSAFFAPEIGVRTKIRIMGGIQGTMCDDCITVSCCALCAACQHARELTNMGIP